MGRFTQAKNWAASLKKNTTVAKVMASDQTRNYAKWMAIGAGVGAVRGAADNIVGEDRVSIFGGAIQGAFLGAGARGMKSLWKYGRGRAAAGKVAPGLPFRGTKPAGII